ncbi:MAG: hypothetical protein ACYDG6_06585 [Thermincolia bacterium]
MYVTKVGELLIPGKTTYPVGAVFEYTPSGPMLVIAFNNPTPQEIEAAKTGQVELALYETDPVIFILHRIKGLETWSDSPFSIRIYQNLEFDWSEEIQEGQGLGLFIVLIDSRTGIVKALRMVGTSTEFARELRAAILRQLERPFNGDEYDAKIDSIYRAFTSEELLTRSIAKHKIRS